MSIPQTPIRYYVEGDPYYWNVDNRPISDLANNQAALASLLGLFLGRAVTPVTATTGTTISAGQILSGNITRTGPGGDFIDTTDSATHILAMIPYAFVGLSIQFTVANLSAHTQTLIAGAGVTMLPVAWTTQTATSRTYLMSVTSVSPPAVTFTTITTGGV